MLHTQSFEFLHPLTDNYPLSMLNVVNKPLLCYQIEYLQQYGIRDIIVTVESRSAEKVQKYL